MSRPKPRVFPYDAPLEPPSRTAPSRIRQVVVALMTVIILGFSLWGFGNKFLEFLALAEGANEGIFAVTPVVNYLLASLGFFCLLIWATMRGMFRDIEKPKYQMLENEAKLDAALRRRHGPPSSVR